MQTDDLLRLNGESFVLHGRPEYIVPNRPLLLAKAEEDGYRVNNLAGLPRPIQVIERLAKVVEERVAANPTLEPWGEEDPKLYVVRDPGNTSIEHFGQSFRAELACIMRLAPVTGIVVVLETDKPISSFDGFRHVEASWRGQLRATE